MPAHFDTHFGQDLCNVLQAELGLVCSFMDAQGCIVASSERARIGQLHPVAQRIMHGEMDEYSVTAQEASADGSVREGVNMAIDIGGTRLVSLGVAGPLAVVRPLARVVHFCVMAVLQTAHERTGPAPAPAAHLGQLLQQTQQTVQQRFARLHHAMDHIDQGIMLLDADMRLVECNRRFLELVAWPAHVDWRGLSAEQLLDHYARHVLTDWPQLRPRALQRIARARAGQPGDFEFISPQGRVLHIQDRPLPGGGVITTYTDITERHRTQAALRAAHEGAEQLVRERTQRLAQIIEGTPLATFVVDAHERITHWNLACTALTGHRAEDMIGSSALWRVFYDSPRPTLINLLVHQASDAEICAQYPEVRRSMLMDGGLEVEVDVGRPDGGPRWLHVTAAPLHDTDGHPCGAIETLQDVTEQRLSQLLLQQTNDALEQRVRERTEALHGQLSFLQQLIESIPSPLFYKDAQGRYLGCNSAFEAVVGLPRAQLLGKRPSDISSVHRNGVFENVDRDLLANPGRKIYETPVQFADGSQHDVIFHKASFTLPDGALGGLVGIMLDITERKRMEEDLRQAATLFENSAEGVMVTDTGGTIIAVNPAFTRITGYTRAQALGRHHRILHSERHGRDFYAAVWATLRHQGRWQGEIWSRRQSGEDYPKWLSITAVRGPGGEVTHYVSSFTDVTVQKQSEERIQQLAFSDPLTQLPNRRLLLDRLEHALSVHARNRRHGALFFIDIDDFKGLNDSRGHYVGDLLLQQVAQRLRACVSSGDTVARLGGDEFVVMLEDLAPEALQAMAQAETVGSRILHTLSSTYELGDVHHHCTASIGVTLFGQARDEVQDLLKQADLAMYRAKASGRNALFFFDPQMQHALDERVALEDALRGALAREQLQLHYQPQVDHQGALVGVEALVRWQRADGQTVAPAQFIPLAEQTDLILPLGHWVLTTACRQLAAWAGQPRWQRLAMAVNVSARQFHHDGFVDQVLQVLEQTGAPAERLKLELTESILITHIDEVASKMAALKARGVGFSLDDFGTGYSSLAYLKRLPLDQLKIDQGFVRNVLTDANDAAIARMVIALADTLGLQVIAEGVEQAGQRDFLAHHGCQLYQGYWFGRPMPLAALQDWVAQHDGAAPE